MVCCHICIMNLILFLITSNNLWWYEKIMIGWMIQLENNVFSLNNTWRLQPIIHTWHWVWLILNIIMRSFIDFLLFWYWKTSVENCWNILAMAWNHNLVNFSAIDNLIFIQCFCTHCIIKLHIHFTYMQHSFYNIFHINLNSNHLCHSVSLIFASNIQVW